MPRPTRPTVRPTHHPPKRPLHQLPTHHNPTRLRNRTRTPTCPMGTYRSHRHRPLHLPRLRTTNNTYRAMGPRTRHPRPCHLPRTPTRGLQPWTPTPPQHHPARLTPTHTTTTPHHPRNHPTHPRQTPHRYTFPVFCNTARQPTRVAHLSRKRVWAARRKLAQNRAILWRVPAVMRRVRPFGWSVYGYPIGVYSTVGWAGFYVSVVQQICAVVQGKAKDLRSWIFV